MSTMSTHHPVSNASWRKRLRAQGYYFRQAAILTIAMGAYLHLTRTFLGDELLQEHILTPTFDRVLTIPMTYAAVTGLLVSGRIAFRGTWHRVGYWLAWFYLAASVPLHVLTAYVLSSTEFIERFPMWFSYLLIPVYASIVLLYSRLRLRR